MNKVTRLFSGDLNKLDKTANYFITINNSAFLNTPNTSGHAFLEVYYIYGTGVFQRLTTAKNGVYIRFHLDAKWQDWYRYMYS